MLSNVLTRLDLASLISDALFLPIRSIAFSILPTSWLKNKLLSSIDFSLRAFTSEIPLSNETVFEVILSLLVCT